MVDDVSATSGADQPQLPVPTERFQRALALASDEADSLGHGFVTCQHLFYALARENRGLASATLTALGITAGQLHELLEDDAALHDRTSQGQIDLADEARDAIERAVTIAQAWEHRRLDTEHLLYGIVIEPTSVDEMLGALNVEPEAVLARLAEMQQVAPSVEIREEANHAYRFALESAWVMSLAVDAARRMGAQRVTAVHLLVALVALPGPAQRVLSDGLGVTEERLVSYLATAVVDIPDQRRLPLDRDVQHILGRAIGEAWNRGHVAVEPLHLAMGLARADRHPALDLLADLGVPQATLFAALDAAMPPEVAG